MAIFEAWRRRRRRAIIAGAVIKTPTDDTSIDPATGAVKSRQAAEISVPAAAIVGIWDPEHLERVARTYWSSLTRFTLGLIHVDYTEAGRSVVFITRRLPLLTFKPPEYEMNRCRGIVRWRIDRGVLVSRASRGGDGYLEIEIERHDEPDGERVRIDVAVEVANFYPSLSGVSRRLYVATQSRIHVVACNFFLRRLVRRELSTSRVGQFAGPDSAAEAPEPRP